MKLTTIATALAAFWVVSGSPVETLEDQALEQTEGVKDLSGVEEWDIEKPKVKRAYIFAFGDSYTRTGWDPTCEVPTDENPIANPLPGITSSGGLNWLGFLVSVFNDHPIWLYNYARGGAVVKRELVSTKEKPVKESTMDFVIQVDMFVNAVGHKPDWAPWDSSNGIAAIWVGGNDIFRTFALANLDVHKEVVAEYINQVNRMYKVGVRKFIFLNIGPTYLTPLRNFPETRDYQKRAFAVDDMNELLTVAFAEYAKKVGDIKYKFVSTYGAFVTAFQNPHEFGAKNNSCFGHATECLWWNKYHPAIEINKLVAIDIVKTWDGPPFHCPDSVKACTSTPAPTPMKHY
ncbi:carbohydrate esterase family 16 protein [Thelonectria olida]|uniref:Carbohydrate esterase family 16 protein n=1 Tax=Thelonectria olida TaxID=1576542 RepID=A0A9P8WFE1_9HYPO|nr:carbohydrate esterase family 16 protein [Thelonectria olida]